MAGFVSKQPNGLYCRFSSVTDCPTAVIHEDGTCHIKTLGGTMKSEYGDYIILGVNGEVYPCKTDIFEKTYEEVLELGE